MKDLHQNRENYLKRYLNFLYSQRKLILIIFIGVIFMFIVQFYAANRGTEQYDKFLKIQIEEIEDHSQDHR